MISQYTAAASECLCHPDDKVNMLAKLHCKCRTCMIPHQKKKGDRHVKVYQYHTFVHLCSSWLEAVKFNYGGCIHGVTQNKGQRFHWDIQYLHYSTLESASCPRRSGDKHI